MPYIKETFDVLTFEHAKHTVLSSDSKDPDKFQRETDFLINIISNQEFIKLDDNSTVLDFGCGMGRVSKELINKYNAKVVGLDISPSMLMFAKLYTANLNKFVGVHQYNVENSIDVALSILALQHAENPEKEIDNIVSVLKPNGIFVLLNENKRFVPSDIDFQNYVIWEDDGFDVFKYTESKLKKLNVVPYIDNIKQIVFYRKEV